MLILSSSGGIPYLQTKGKPLGEGGRRERLTENSDRDMKRVRAFVTGFAQAWTLDKPDRMAAALAFFALFSFVPLLYIALVVAGFFLNDQVVRDQVLFQMQRTLGTQTAEFLQELMNRQMQQRAGNSLLVSLIGFAILLYFASGLFAMLEDMLNMIWRNPFPSQHGFLHIVRTQLLSFVLVLGVGLFLIAMTVASVVVEQVGGRLQLESSLFLANGIVLFLITACSFAILYRVLARVKPPWGALWLGAFAAAFLFSIGRWLFSLYVELSNLNSAFAAASALAVVLLAIYYGALIFLVGAILIRLFSPESQVQAK